jgi:FtsP/CotA-like multicopper oxidase with cupredoxin domain
VSSPALRRHLLGSPLFAVACAAAASACVQTPPAAGPTTATVAVQGVRSASTPGQELRQPRLIQSRPVTVNGRPDRVLEATLEVVLRTMVVPQPAGDSTWTLRTYRVREANGVPWTDGDSVGFPGPTFRVSPGDSVSIKLINSLPPLGNDSTCLPMAVGHDNPPDCFHGFNYTNIHYHGFHVSPSPNADDVLLQVAPNGGTFQYGFRIPPTQSPGTHWYHPHKHGSVAIQVVNGMSGAFEVVDSTRGLDSVQVANNITEKLLAFQQISDSLNLMVPKHPPHPATLVNGMYLPQVTMQQGEVQRWRIVNENMTKTAAFSLSFINGPGVEPKLYEVARDGVTYAPGNFNSQDDNVLLMAPGNRLDVLVQAPPNAGVFRATITHIEHVDEEDDESRKRPQVLRGTGSGPGGTRVAAAAPTTTEVLTVNVVAPTGPVTSTFPSALPPLPGFLANLPGSLAGSTIPADSMEVVVFSRQGNPGSPPEFFLGTQQDSLMQFNPGAVYVPTTGVGTGVQRPMRLDSLQTWKVVNRDPATNHPFHIHVNPFQVVYVHAPNTGDSYQPLYDRLNAAASAGSPIWLDVLPLPEAAGSDEGYAIIRQQYDDFPGWYVMHCHILGHEERGMMQVLQVVAPGDVVRPPPPSVTDPTNSGAAAHRH